MSRPGPGALGSGPEFDLIRRILAGRATPAWVSVGPGDDCAILAGSLAVSVDMSVEDVHFRRAWLEPEEIGFRAAAGALSDLAAVAARPLGLLSSVAVPRKDAAGFAEAVARGVGEAADEVGAAVLGGDVTESPDRLVLDVVVLGEAGRPVLRSGAMPGDELWVTGRLGGAAAAVRAWEAGREPQPAARRAYARPVPRVREAAWLLERDLLRAMIDLSDGLAGDAEHIGVASGVSVLIEEAAIPVHPDAADADEALSGGEDYELLLAARPGSVAGHRREFANRFGIELTMVGSAGEGSGVYVRRRNGSEEPLAGASFRHFTGGAP